MRNQWNKLAMQHEDPASMSVLDKIFTKQRDSQERAYSEQSSAALKLNRM